MIKPVRHQGDRIYPRSCRKYWCHPGRAEQDPGPTRFQRVGGLNKLDREKFNHFNKLYCE